MNQSTELEKLQMRREQIAAEMLQIHSLVRGTLTEQFLKVPHKGKKEPVMRGPYYVLSRSERGKTHSRRIPKDEVVQVRQDVDNYKRIKALSRELIVLTEQQGQAQRQEAASEEAVKKGLKPRSKRTRKSSASSK